MPPLSKKNKDYSRLVKHTIKNTLIEVSKLSNAKKAAAILAHHRINQKNSALQLGQLLTRTARQPAGLIDTFMEVAP